jgi:hypothetical protein
MTMKERGLSGLLACFGFAIVCLGPVESAAEPQCKCRAPSQSYLVGACVCLQRPGGAQELACCGKVLNNPSWRFTGKGCPIAKTEPATPAPVRTFSGDDFDVAPKAAFTRHGAYMPH